MGYCYWCHWGWPNPIYTIYRDALSKLNGDDSPLLFGPAHIVWEDENWNSAQWCIDHFDEYRRDMTDHEADVVRESLVKLLSVPDEYKKEPEGFDQDNSDPADFPPPQHWECERR